MILRRRKSPDASIARRLPGFDARHATRRARSTRRVSFYGVVVAAIAVLVLYLTGSIGSSGGPHPTGPRTAGSGSQTTTTAASGKTRDAEAPVVSASLFGSRLSASIGGATALAGPGADLLIVGGETQASAPAQGVFTFDTSTGSLQHVCDLTTALEDTSAAEIGGRDVVLGGGSPAAVSTVQALPPLSTSSSAAGNGATTASAVPIASVIGSLPQPRTDASVAQIGATTYVVGGDNGTVAEPSVLATENGSTFSVAGTLVRPVRYPAVAAVGPTIYVLGGEVPTTVGGWMPVDTIQVFEPGKHKSKVVGHLPEPLSEASAVTIAGRVIVVGGIVATSAPPVGPGSSPPQGVAGAHQVATVSWFDPAKLTVTPVAQLPDAVSLAAVGVVGTTAWVIGGDYNGNPISAVQSLEVSNPPGRH